MTARCGRQTLRIALERLRHLDRVCDHAIDLGHHVVDQAEGVFQHVADQVRDRQATLARLILEGALQILRYARLNQPVFARAVVHTLWRLRAKLSELRAACARACGGCALPRPASYDA